MSLSTFAIVTVQSARGKAAARYSVALVCGASAGIHAALVPDHLREGGLSLGGSFALAAVSLAIVAVLISAPTRDRWAPIAAMAVLGGVVIAYVLSRTSGIPHLIPVAEDPDPIGLITTTAEAAALAAAALLTPSRKDKP